MGGRAGIIPELEEERGQSTTLTKEVKLVGEGTRRKGQALGGKRERNRVPCGLCSQRRGLEGGGCGRALCRGFGPGGQMGLTFSCTHLTICRPTLGLRRGHRLPVCTRALECAAAGPAANSKGS